MAINNAASRETSSSSLNCLQTEYVRAVAPMENITITNLAIHIFTPNIFHKKKNIKDNNGNCGNASR